MKRDARPDALLQPADRRDARRLARLWVRAFPDRRTVDERMRQLRDDEGYGGIDTAWLVERDGQLAAACRLYSMTQIVAGAELPMMGVAGVAVEAAFRTRGLGRTLCADALRIGRERGDVVSVLYPFRPEFYRSLGWGYVGTLHEHRFSPRAIDVDPGLAAGVRYADGDADRAAIEACYERVARTSHGPILRRPAAWDARLAAGDAIVATGQAGIGGYVLIQPLSRRVNADRVLRIRELVAEDDVAYTALLAWLGAQRDQWPIIEHDARPDERLDLRLRDPRPPRFVDRPGRALWDPVGRVLRGPMLRALDVPRALEVRRWGPVPAGGARLRIEVRDAELPENVGPWSVEVEAGEARVTEGPCTGADAALTCAPDAFAQIWTGELGASEAARLGNAQVDDPERILDYAFAVPQPFWLLDAF